MKKKQIAAFCVALAFTFGPGYYSAQANEVNKGEIPQAELASTYKTLAWGNPIWDNGEMITAYNDDAKMLIVDTRPDSFFTKGTLSNAVLLPFDKSDAADNGLTEEALAAAITKAGLSKDSAKIVFFCQGPKCHRSYNAAFIATTKWNYKPENVIWYRDGYPNLVQQIQADPKLKRKASKYLSEEAMKSL
ncbi:MAG: rhodanese-like domain-containing protein [Desulfobulbaceae bacterium]|nr:rhodanese-like domain-containing protein [Desulfobulbaceae bacterium]MDP2105772.1 rhodanese-like domain-containing protein [Desulfobulbaceae bacterium]